MKRNVQNEIESAMTEVCDEKTEQCYIEQCSAGIMQNSNTQKRVAQISEDDEV